MVNAFSFCLYGPENPRYYPGMLENVYLAGIHFPAWKVYIYHAPDVTHSILNHLAACSNVVLKPTGVTGPKNMIHRFFAIDEPGVDLMMVRDADSRIHWKDRWAIRRFVASPYLAHTIRDNIEHTARMMGGLWGIKKSAGLNIRAEYDAYVEDTSLGHRNAHDQNFLADVIYPKVLPTLLVHRSRVPIFAGEHNTEVFPFEWSNDVYCGRIEQGFVDTPEPPPTRFKLFPAVPMPMRLPEPEVPVVSPSFTVAHPPLQFLRKK